MLNSLSSEELEFVKAIEKYKKEKSQAFLSWSEVLSILKDLGYRKSDRHRRTKPAKTSKTSKGSKSAKKRPQKAAARSRKS